jgi:K(+)-stimulated pyrophosphate-energized sodium pump
MNPVIKFTTLFGLLAVELAVAIRSPQGQFGEGGMLISHILALAFFVVSTFFVWRSFYRMRIGSVKIAASDARIDS